MQHRACALVLVAAAVAAISTCGDGPTENARRIATSFLIVAGDDQEAVVGMQLPDPIVVRATDAQGAVVAGAVVNFVVAGGGGSVFAPAVSTNADGTASNRWTLGPTAGTQTLEVRAIDQDGEPVTYAVIEATALADVPASVTRVSPDGLSGVAGTAAPEPLAVRVADQYGNAVANVPVAWAAAGGGSVESASSITDAVGVAKTQLTLPPTVGSSEVTATVAGIPPLSMTAMARVGTAAALEVMSGNDQRASILDALDAPLIARVTDAHGNSVEGATVTWATTSGSIAPATTTSDDEGRVSATWTLSTVAGVGTATATLEDGLDVVTFSATAMPGRPISVVLIAGDDQTGAAGETLPQPLEVEVRDFYQNLVPEATVNWMMVEGGGSVSPGMSTTNDAGRGTTLWTLGAPGANRVVATVGGAGSVEFTATALAPTGLILTPGEGNGRSPIVNGSVTLTARLTDGGGAPVAGATVAWHVASEPDPARTTARVNPLTSVTNADGKASTFLYVGTVAGAVTVEASVPNVEPAVFGVTVIPGAIAHFRTGADYPESGLAGSTITFDLEYTDNFGNAVPSPARTWTSLPGANGAWTSAPCGSLGTAATDERNVAKATWSLCHVAGYTTAYFLAVDVIKPQLDIPTRGEPMTLKLVHTESDFEGTVRWVQITGTEGMPGGPPITITVTSGSGTVVRETAPYGLHRLSGRRGDPNEPFTVTVSASGYASLELTF